MYGEQNEASDALVRSKMVKGFSGGWQCTECDFAHAGKTALNTLYAHVESNHVNVSFVCYIYSFAYFLKMSGKIENRLVRLTK